MKNFLFVHITLLALLLFACNKNTNDERIKESKTNINIQNEDDFIKVGDYRLKVKNIMDIESRIGILQFLYS